MKDIPKRAKIIWAEHMRKFGGWGGGNVSLKTNKSVVIVLWDGLTGFCEMSCVSTVIDFITLWICAYNSTLP